METGESKVKILSLEMPEGAEEENNDADEDTADDSADPHKALAQIKFDEFLQQEKALKSINELSLKEKATKSGRTKSRESSSRDENGVKSKKKKKTKDESKDEERKEHKKSKKSKKAKKEKAEDAEKENAIGMSELWVMVVWDFELTSLPLPSRRTKRTASGEG